MGFGSTLQRLTAGLARTRESLFGKVQRLIVARSVIDDEFLDELEEILIAGDVGAATTHEILENLRSRVKADRYESSDELMNLIKNEMTKLLTYDSPQGANGFSLPPSPRPFVIMVVGVNGVGKTTTIGKLAFRFADAGHSVLIGAADTFRAAANEQLDIWARRANVQIIQQRHGADPAAVAFDTLSSALARKSDVVIIDTAGRLHTKTNLMEELKKVGRVMDKLMPGAPHEVLLVLDASTGQNALQQAKQFTQAVPLTGLVISKLDGTAKGGVVFGVSRELKVPVKYIGVGEELEDLQPFDPTSFTEALFTGTEEKRIHV